MAHQPSSTVRISLDSDASDAYSHLSSETSFFTASMFHGVDFWSSGGASLSSVFYSINDPAIVNIETVEDLRTTFCGINVSADVVEVSHAIAGIGGYSDVVRGSVRVEEEHLLSVAIKKPRVFEHGREALQKLAREIALWSTLTHDNILPLLGLVWLDSDIPAMVSPWCQQGNATEFLLSKRDDPHAASLVYRILQEVLQALDYLHSVAVTHGDLKGANILIRDDGTACLGDFGISAVLAQYPRRDASPVGTVRWTAPELYGDSQALTPECDIWSFGCVIIEVVSCEKPHHTLKTERGVLIALGQKKAPTRPDTFPEAYWQLCEDCFAIEPSARPSAKVLLFRLFAQDENFDSIASQYRTPSTVGTSGDFATRDRVTSNTVITRSIPPLFGMSDSTRPGRQVRESPRKIALIIGVQYATRYPRPMRSALRAPYRDIQRFYKALNERGFQTCMMLDSEDTAKDLHPTRLNILRELNGLTQLVQPGDKLVFCYTGRGRATWEEDKGTGPYIVPLDSALNGCITSNTLRTILYTCLPPGAKLLTVFDCSFSASMLSLKYNWDGNTDGPSVTLPPTRQQGYSSFFPFAKLLGGAVRPSIPADVLADVVSFSGAKETAWRSKGYGDTFLKTFLDSLQKGGGDVTIGAALQASRDGLVSDPSEYKSTLRDPGNQQRPSLASNTLLDLNQPLSSWF